MRIVFNPFRPFAFVRRHPATRWSPIAQPSNGHPGNANGRQGLRQANATQKRLLHRCRILLNTVDHPDHPLRGSAAVSGSVERARLVLHDQSVQSASAWRSTINGCGGDCLNDHQPERVGAR
jgi:hypothetical protein